MDVALRRAGPDDADAVADLVLASRHASVPYYPPLAHPDDDVRRWVREQLLPEDEVWLAVTPSDDPVGVIALQPTWVEHLHVRPGDTGLGIGAAMLDHAKRLQPGGLQLWVFVSNAGARRFYERHGFVTVEQTDGSTTMEGQPDLRYVWSGNGSAGLG